MAFLMRLLDSALAAPDDTATVLAKKKGWALLLLAGITCNPIAIVNGLVTANPLEMYMGIVFTPIVSLCFFYMCITKRLTTGLMVVATTLGISNMTVYDLAVMPHGYRGWSVAIMVLDGLLLARAPGQLRLVCVGWVIVWLLVTEFERVYRFGLLDFPLLSDYDNRGAVCCEKPPCGSHNALELRGALIPLVTFIVDFIATNGFATALEEEKSRMEIAVKTAKQVAAGLATFDLAMAARNLNESPDALPEDLHEAFSTILSNLDSYRPYIPDALFKLQLQARSLRADRGRNPLAARPGTEGDNIPGLWPDSRAAVVFTNIRHSTALWDTSAAVMMSALATHTEIVRRAIRSHSGYEVKSVGDSFMVAFSKVVGAVEFAVAVHTGLAEDSVWPLGLSRGRDGEDEFPTLCVRIGIDYGDVIVEQNVLTNRYDYFGTTVNAAARAENRGVAGAITMTDRAMAVVLRHPLIVGLDLTVVPYPLERGGAVMDARERLGSAALIPPVMKALEPVVRRYAAGDRDSGRTGGRHTATASRTAVSSSLSSNGQRALHTFEQLDSEEDARGNADKRSRISGRSATSDSGLHPDFVSIGESFGPSYRTPRVTATVGVVKLDIYSDWCTQTLADEACSDLSPDARMSTMLVALHDCLQATHGVLTTVHNCTVLLSWNAHTACPQYINNSAKFLTQLQARFATAAGATPRARGADQFETVATSDCNSRGSCVWAPNGHAAPSPRNDVASPVSAASAARRVDDKPMAAPALPFTMGLATGTVISGQVSASNSQRFITILGACVDTAYMLSAAAAELNASVIAASFSRDATSRYEHSEFYVGAIRPVDVWFGAATAGVGALRQQEDTAEAGAAPPVEVRSSTTTQCTGGGRGGEGGLSTPAQGTILYEVSLPTLAANEIRAQEIFNFHTFCVGAADESSACETAAPPVAWSHEYTRAFAARDLSRLKKWGETDPVVARVHKMLLNNTHLQHAWAGRAADGTDVP